MFLNRHLNICNIFYPLERNLKKVISGSTFDGIMLFKYYNPKKVSKTLLSYLFKKGLTFFLYPVFGKSIRISNYVNAKFWI